MTPEPAQVPASEPELTSKLTPEQRQRVVLEEQLKGLSKSMYGRQGIIAMIFVFIIWFCLGGSIASDYTQSLTAQIVWGVVVGAVGAGLTMGVMTFIRSRVRAKLVQRNIAVRTEELQERLDENFFTNLVKINFKYIDKYYLQTQVQANKSFLLSGFAAVVSFGVVVAGIVLIYVNKTQATAGYVAAGAGCLGEFVAAVFFYLYNQTIIKMGEYHQKLVLTQNIALALKITDDLQGESQTNARVKLIETLTNDINRYLTASSPVAAPAKPKIAA